MLNRSLADELEAVLAHEGVPTLAILTCHGGRIERQLFGRERIAWESELLVPLASASKPLVAMAIAELATAGGVALSEAVEPQLGKEIPILRDVTVADLLAHQTRIPASVGESWLTTDEKIERLGVSSPEPASPFLNYQDFHYVLAARLCAVRGQQSFENLVAKALFRPAGLSAATMIPDGPVLQGHLLDRGRTIPIKGDFHSDNAAGNGVHLTLSDLERFLPHLLARADVLAERTGWLIPRAQAQGTLLFRVSHPFVDEVHYGPGWWMERLDGECFYHHPGMGAGCEVTLGFNPRREFAYAVLTNAQNGVRAQTSAIQCARLAVYLTLFGKRVPDLKGVAQSRETLIGRTLAIASGTARPPASGILFHHLCGAYEKADWGGVTVRSIGGSLVAEFHDRAHLQPRWLFGNDAAQLTGRSFRDQSSDIVGAPVFSFQCENGRCSSVSVQGALLRRVK